MTLPANKTKIVCTIGPASSRPEILEDMIRAGMNIARLNFSHGDFESHRRIIAALRAAERTTGRRVTIMADLPGPKIRIGTLAREPVDLVAGSEFRLTTDSTAGGPDRVPVTFSGLPRVVKPGDALYLNDGVIRLEVLAIARNDVVCVVREGGLLHSRKGLNLPGIELGIPAFTEWDRTCLKFAMEEGLEAVSQSFVEKASDIADVREAATALGRSPFIIAKIERARALDRLEDILKKADGIMIARGDLGVEVPIERMAVVQKALMQAPNRLGKPVITATQMLESMTHNPRPTRAESTDVANAVLDGTDCVMLSGESAIGRFPVEATAMLARIAAGVEPHRPSRRLRKDPVIEGQPEEASLTDLIALSIERILSIRPPAAIVVPTLSGRTARNVARFRHPLWITAVSPLEKTCRELQFSYGVLPVLETDLQEDWTAWTRRWMRDNGIAGGLAILTEGPSPKNPEANHRLELLDLGA
jgi:pyruvate kinase